MNRSFVLIIGIGLLLIASFSCRKPNTEFVTIALPEKFSAFDTLTSTSNDASAERVRNLMFNSLVKKDANFDYTGELAKTIDVSPDGMTITFTLRDGVKFHNGKEFTSADVKYTFDKLFESKGFKSGGFFDTEPIGKAAVPVSTPVATNTNATTNITAKPVETKRVPHIVSMETPDAKTVVVKIAKPSLRNQLLSNFVAVPIIPEGTVDQQKDNPVGSGPFIFKSFDASQNIVELAANEEYWEGAPKVKKLKVKTVTDANSLQAELQTGGVDIALNPSNLPPDTIRSLGNNADLKVEQSDGSNIQYLVFNTQSAPLNSPKVRQAIGHAIDRKKIVSELLFDQARVADSVLPPSSWAYTPGTQYTYDPEKAKALLKEAGYKNEPIVFKYGSGSLAVSQYAQVIQSSLVDAGFNIQIETLEGNTIRLQLAQGEFQIYTGVWIGGNQDPMFMRDLFSSTRIPGGTVSCCNRGRYSNPEVDKLLEDAMNSTDKAETKDLYVRAWTAISNDLPLFPLWYPSNVVVMTKRIGNVKISPSGDWSFVKDITVAN